MQKINIIYFSIFTLLLFSECNAKNLNNEKEKILGEQLFFDNILSKNNTQSCATCHNPKHAFIDNRDNGVGGAVSLGDDQVSLGTRNTPTVSYAMYIPKFHYNAKKDKYIGGQFYDGRKDTLKDQAGEPPLNPTEMGIPSKQFLVNRLKNNKQYNKQFKELYGDDVFDNTNKTYELMTQAIQSFEQTKQFAPFDSKYDRFLEGKYDLSVLEDLGRTLFFSNNNNNCASCHVLKTEDSPKETFTNYAYHNIGVPKNKRLLSKNNKNFIDHGLLENLQITNIKYDGKIKVPTLRNIAVTSPYMHNGVFDKLTTVVKFYDKYVNKNRKINPETNQAWAKAEVKIGLEDLKLLKKAKKLNDRKIKALVAFMNLLTDKKYEHLIKKDN